MSLDIYSVNVVHITNPHLIYVEVSNPSDQFTFEQIGLYGILPLENTLDVEYNELIIQKSDTWVPASTKILRDICEENSELSFSPTYIDRSPTIFNDNFHKYGEVLIKSKNGKVRTLSKLLIKRNLAYLDISEFHKKISSGNLSTKLTNIKTQEIIKEIENYYLKKQNSNKDWAKAVKDQTSVFQLSQKLDSLLTVSNVEKHNNQMLKKILENKSRDFELCKEVEEDSVGCGIKPRSSLDRACAIRYRMAEHKLQDDQHIKLNNIRKYLVANSKRKEDDRSEVSEQESISSYNSILNKRRHLCKLLQQTKQHPFKKETEKSLQPYDSDETFSVSSSIETYRKSLDDKKHITKDHTQIYMSSSDSFEGVDLLSKSPNPHRNVITKKPKKYVNLKQIAYGPPELDRKKFKIELKSRDLLVHDNNTIKEYKKLEVNEIVINNEHNIENAKIDKNIPNKSLAKINFVKEKAINDTFDDNLHKSDSIETSKTIISVLEMKLKNFENYSKITTSSNSNISIQKAISNDSDEDIDEVIKINKAKYKTEQVNEKKSDNISESVKSETAMVHYNVNPFRNIDPSISVFVDKLVSPVLMVHTKLNRRIQTIQNLQEVCFNKHIHEVLKRMKIHNPMMLQTVSWPIILRGYSLFMISPLNSGKTIGYLPAVCRLVSDSSRIIDSAGPISIIVCATAKLVAHIENIAKQFLGLEDRVLACYAGVDELHVTTTLLNGCDLLISTPIFLYNLLQKTDFGVDLRRLSSFVLDDCERLFKIYANEVKYFQFKIKEMLKRRVQKELNVQYILASRVWCNSMESLAFKAPNTVICIGAFQECVMYSKTAVSVSFIKRDPSLKLTYLQEFLQSIDQSKKTAIVCATDDEVEWLERSLKTVRPSQIIYATNNKMTVHDLYNLTVLWSECKVPSVGPILICCDGNLTHMNVIDSHYLVHFSLPRLFSMFSKRFSVLNNNYPSIFKNDNSDVKIKIFVEESNCEHLPKLINFIKRTTDVPDVLEKVCENISMEKDAFKAKSFVPICDSLLMLGYCPDLFHCHERHTILKEYDLPLEWLPEKGFVTFKLLRYHSAISYSGRILSNIVEGNSTKYPQTYNMLSLKMGMHYSKEINRQLHRFPNVGDICAVAINGSLYMRCQVVKILSTYERGNPNNVLIKLIDEEWYEITSDIHLYYLPDELKSVETRVAQIRIVNITPKDNDITFSDLAKNHIKNIIDSEDELYLRAHIALTIGNCIFVDTLEVCQDLTSLNEVVVKLDIKHELLKKHAILNENILPHLKQLCIKSGLASKVLTTVPLKGNCKDTEENIKIEENIDCNDLSENLSVTNVMTSCNNEELFEAYNKANIEKFNDNDEVKQIIEKIPNQTVIEKYTQGKWSNLDGDDFIRVYIAASKNPDNFFTRLADFEPMAVLLDKISAYVENIDNTHVNLREGEIVLAKYSDDATYERARIEEINEESVECFFLDQGDQMEISISHLLPITEEIISKLPFQAIECRLLGVQPPVDEWTESTNKWFFDYCFEGKNPKILRTKYYTKTPSKFTGDFKYGVVLYDKNTDTGEEVLINQLLIDLDLALKNTEEMQYFEIFDDKIKDMEISDTKTVKDDTKIEMPPSTLLLQKPIRTMPLVDSDDSDDDKWDVVMDSDTVQNFAPLVKNIPIRQLPLTLENIEIGERSNVKESFRLVMENEKQNVTKPETIVENKITKRPKLIWRQNLTTVFVSILIDVENYDLQIKDKGLKFCAELNNATYEFDIQLYGVIYKEKSSHDKKGLVISVKLEKINKIKWLELTRDHFKNWITYDVSADDISSEEEDKVNTKDLENYIKTTREENSDSEDDEFHDDLNR